MTVPLPDITSPYSAVLLKNESVADGLGEGPVGGMTKRTFDLLCAAIAFVVFSPLFVLIAILVKCSDGGPILYGHGRIGCSMQPFSCLKFRTMVVDADAVLAQYLRDRPEAAREWRETRKLKSDPRITAVGAILRQLSLDELPQLINILRGEMSVVGPRPIVLDEMKLYGKYARFYLRARPGLTGPWQVSGRNDVSYKRRVALDQAYVRTWSLWTDVAIVLRTIPAVIMMRGTY
jgi:exopolysaccharide production protein ExoY